MWKTMLALMVARPNGKLGWMFFLLPVLRGPMLVRTVTLMVAAYYLAPSVKRDRQPITDAGPPRIRPEPAGKAEVLPW